MALKPRLTPDGGVVPRPEMLAYYWGVVVQFPFYAGIFGIIIYMVIISACFLLLPVFFKV